MKCKTLGLRKEIKYSLIREKIFYPKRSHELGTIKNHVLVYYKISLLFGCKVQQGIVILIRETRVGKKILKNE